MRQILKNIKWEMFISSLVFIAVGIFMVVSPDNVITVISVAIAAFFFLLAVKYLLEYTRKDPVVSGYQYRLVLAAIFGVLGVVVLMNMSTILSIATYLVAVVIFICGVMRLENAIDMKRLGHHWIPMLVLSVVYILIGVFILMAPMNNDNGTYSAGETLIIGMGVALIVVGLIDLILNLALIPRIRIWHIDLDLNRENSDDEETDTDEVLTTEGKEVD